MLKSIPTLRSIATLLPHISPTALMNTEIKITRKPRYDGRSKKRPWEDRRSDRGAALDPTTVPKQPKTETPLTADLIDKIKRRKFALLLAYSGANYFGMQRNPNTRTIEEALCESLLQNGFITAENFGQVQTMQFQRAARTDKGVSAARQVVSMKLKESVDIERINALLPPEIRVFGLRRVTKGFNSKVQCDARSYVYILPTVAFLDKDQEMVQDGYRIDQGTLDRIDAILANYVGTHNFHNFTARKRAQDPSARRFMKSFACGAPFVREGVEFVALKVQGQSFMLHQIRKMVGLVLAIAKGYTGEETMRAAFGLERVNVPKAPGLGLVLDFVHYERYDHRYGGDGVHEKLVWEAEEDRIEEFKMNFIYPNIVRTEIEAKEMLAWLSDILPLHKYDGEEDEKSDLDGAENEEKT